MMYFQTLIIQSEKLKSKSISNEVSTHKRSISLYIHKCTLVYVIVHDDCVKLK